MRDNRLIIIDYAKYLYIYHWSRVISICAIKGFDVLELKHVSLYKGLADLLIGPGDEEFVVVIGFLRQPGGEINGCFQIHSLPVKVNNQLLDTVLCQYTVSRSILTEYIMP